MAYVNLDNNEILLAETHTKKIQTRELVMKCISIVRRHVIRDSSIINRRNVFDILLHSINMIADTESEFIEYFNASLVFLMYIYKHPDRFSAVRWSKKKHIELYLCDSVNDQIYETFYTNDDQYDPKLNQSHMTARKAILECYSSTKIIDDLNGSIDYITSARKTIDEISIKKRFFSIYSKPIETSFEINYSMNVDGTAFSHDNIVIINFKCISSTISFHIVIPTGVMTLYINDEDDISHFDSYMLNHIFSNWIRYLIYPGGSEMCDFKIYNRISKEYKPSKYIYYLRMSYRGTVVRSFVINRKITYWWILNYQALGDRDKFGINPERSLWSMEMHHELLKKTTKKTIDCIFHSELSPSFLLVPIRGSISHYAGILFIDNEESVFDHEIYKQWFECSNIFPPCSCANKDRGYNVYEMISSSHEDFLWFHDALFKGYYTLPAISFGQQPCSSSTGCDNTITVIPTSPVDVRLYLIHDIPSNGGDVIGNGIKFPTLRLVEGYRYKIIIDPVNIFPSIVEKYVGRTFSIWYELDDGRKITVTSYGIFDDNPDPFVAEIHKNMHYGEIGVTNWGFCEVSSQQQYLDTVNDFSLFVDHKYCPEVVMEKNRLLTLESSIKTNLNAVQLGANDGKYKGQLFVFILDGYNEHDPHIIRKMDKNLIYKEHIASRAAMTKSFIIKYTICDAINIKSIFEPSNINKIVHDMSETDIIQVDNINKYRFLYVLHPSTGRTVPLSATLPNMITISARGKTQSVYCINLSKHKNISVDNAVSITASSDVKDVEFSTKTAFNTHLKFATLKATSPSL